jgi:hypothetical protein
MFGVFIPVTALENEVGIRQYRPKCRPINSQSKNLLVLIAVKKSAIIEFDS